MGDGDLTRKGKWILTVTSLAMSLALVFWGCGKPKETPLERAERLLVKDDPASLKEAKVALQEALTANPQAARVHFLLGTAYLKEGKGEQNRNKLEEIYGNATTELEKALELYGQSGAPVEVYQQLVDVCHERALVPKRFNAEKDLRVGVGPWEVKAMEKAIKTFEQGRARFPNDPAFAAEKAKALQEELARLKALYTENVYKAWASRPAGYMSPEEYQKQKRYE
jgi:tetratricopeptide (TPR) repeat protein